MSGVEIDNQLKWKAHVNEVIKSFVQKLNLLKSQYFLPIQAKVDFYHKVVLPSVTYGLIIWGSCGTVLFDELERIHVQAPRIVYGLNWQMPTIDVYTKVKWNHLKKSILKSY